MQHTFGTNVFIYIRPMHTFAVTYDFVIHPLLARLISMWLGVPGWPHVDLLRCAQTTLGLTPRCLFEHYLNHTRWWLVGSLGHHHGVFLGCLLEALCVGGSR
jgi:hypothetical protein